MKMKIIDRINKYSFSERVKYYDNSFTNIERTISIYGIGQTFNYLSDVIDINMEFIEEFKECLNWEVIFVRVCDEYTELLPCILNKYSYYILGVLYNTYHCIINTATGLYKNINILVINYAKHIPWKVLLKKDLYKNITYDILSLFMFTSISLNSSFTFPLILIGVSK